MPDGSQTPPFGAFDVSLILWLDLAQIWVRIVFLDKKKTLGLCPCLKNDQFAEKRYRSRILAHFDVSMILCLYLAKIRITIVFSNKKNIGIMPMSQEWLICGKTLPFACFSAFQRFYDLMVRFGSNLGYNGFFYKKKLWVHVHVSKMTDLLKNTTVRPF